MPSVNFNYVLGFVIVIVLIYMSLEILLHVRTSRYQLTTEDALPQVGITVITNRGPLRLDKHMFFHYINRLKENLEYLSKQVDPEKCEMIKSQLQIAKESLTSQIDQHTGLLLRDDIKTERLRLRKRIDTMAEIVFSNNQNPDNAQSIILEMILDLETLMYMTKMIPNEIESIDVRDVDQIAKLIYEHACYPTQTKEELNSDIQHWDNSPEKPFEDSFIADPKHSPGSFETFVDFSKHQNITETRRSTSTYKPSLKNQKKNLKNLRKISLESANVNKERYGANKSRKYKTFKESDGTDPIRDRVLQAREAFTAENPNRYIRKKSSLIEDYNELEDATLHPALAFAY